MPRVREQQESQEYHDWLEGCKGMLISEYPFSPVDEWTVCEDGTVITGAFDPVHVVEWKWAFTLPK